LQFAAQVAASERDRLGLGRLDPIENLFRLTDERGLRIFFYLLDDVDIFGVSAFSRQYGTCILLNSSNTLERQIFSLAHEYAHPLMHRAFYKSPEPMATLQSDHQLELMADTFAANLLVPETGLREAFQRDVGAKAATLEDIIFLKHHFRVSAEVMIRRLAELDLFPGSNRSRCSTKSTGDGNQRKKLLLFPTTSSRSGSRPIVLSTSQRKPRLPKRFPSASSRSCWELPS
jgi:Zn-dependent peptidase ImmA (M78 family)